MPEFIMLSPSEQVAVHLRGELSRGRWSGTMPGAPALAAELGIDGKTVGAALGLLETEGLLASQGAGRPRRIVMPSRCIAAGLRIAILDYEPLALADGYMAGLQHHLSASGHQSFFTERSLMELRMDVRRVARLVERTAADAWVVGAGSREVLQWFVDRGIPTMALFGRRRGLQIAAVGPNKPPVYAALTRQLVELGHRRIVLLARAARRLPEPGKSECAFLDELRACGIPPGRYHLPDWRETLAGFHAMIESLFALTPPTALIVDEVEFFFAAQQSLMNLGLRVPRDVSLVSTDSDPHFAWMQPSVACIRWDSRPVVRRVVRWADNVSRGRDDRRQTLTKAEFVEGGTIGPVSAPH